MISVSPVLSLSDTGSHPHNAGDWISKNDFISLFPQIFHGKQISLWFKADILVGDSTVILVPLRLIDWSFAVCFVSWICPRVIFSFFIRQLIFHQMNPFTLADCRCGAIQQVLFRAEDNKGSICVGCHELVVFLCSLRRVMTRGEEIGLCFVNIYTLSCE